MSPVTYQTIRLSKGKHTSKERLRAVTPKPPLDVLGAGAVRSLSTHDDRTHTRMLALIDSLLALGAPEQMPSAPEPARAPSQRRPERTPAA